MPRRNRQNAPSRPLPPFAHSAPRATHLAFARDAYVYKDQRDAPTRAMEPGRCKSVRQGEPRTRRSSHSYNINIEPRNWLLAGRLSVCVEALRRLSPRARSLGRDHGCSAHYCWHSCPASACIAPRVWQRALRDISRATRKTWLHKSQTRKWQRLRGWPGGLRHGQWTEWDLQLSALHR